MHKYEQVTCQSNWQSFKMSSVIKESLSPLEKVTHSCVYEYKKRECPYKSVTYSEVNLSKHAFNRAEQPSDVQCSRHTIDWVKCEPGSGNIPAISQVLIGSFFHSCIEAWHMMPELKNMQFRQHNSCLVWHLCIDSRWTRQWSTMPSHWARLPR